MKRWVIGLALVLLGWQNKAQAQALHTIIWRNTQTNQMVYWNFNGAKYTTGDNVANFSVDPQWTVVTGADLNGDGNPYLIFQNATTGQIGYWQLASSKLVSGGILASSVPPQWRLEAAADINGDGKADLLWHNSQTGEVRYWLMNGLQFLSDGTITTGVAADWKIVTGVHLSGAAGPLSLIWRNPAAGVHSYWTLHGTKISSTGYFTPYFADPAWAVVGMVDLDGDGHPDLIFENLDTNQISYWLMNGTTRISSNDFFSFRPAKEWRIEAVL